MRDRNWDDLRFVLAAARTESFSLAARQLDVNESTVARRIAQAERRLRVRLFERTPGRLQPTEVGAELIRRAESVEREIQAAESALIGADERAAGTVRVTSVPLIVNRVLAPALPRLLAEHPQLRIELVADPQNLSLTKREADISLRLARPHKEVRAIARRIGLLAYASYGPSGGQSETLPWITYDDRMADLPQARWIDELIARDRAMPPQLVANDAETILQCVKAGIGKSLLPVAIGEREPGLVRLGDCPRSLSRELWLMVHPDLRDLTRTCVTMEWLTAAVNRFLTLTDRRVDTAR